jgi:hypothetical protein
MNSEHRVLPSLRLLPAALLAICASVAAQPNIRPISDLLRSQGTFTPPPSSGCTPYNGTCLFFPPVQNYVAWGAPASNTAGLADYAALANSYLVAASRGRVDLHTRVDGVVIERPVSGDTRALVDVYILARSALAFGFPVYGFSPPLAFGYLATEVLAGRPAAVGDVYMHVTFLNPGGVGAPLPDLVQAMVFPDPEQVLLGFEFACYATGHLRAPSGWPEGTPGSMTIVQTGYSTGNGGFVYPIERVDFARRR